MPLKCQSTTCRGGKKHLIQSFVHLCTVTTTSSSKASLKAHFSLVLLCTVASPQSLSSRSPRRSGDHRRNGSCLVWTARLMSLHQNAAPDLVIFGSTIQVGIEKWCQFGCKLRKPSSTPLRLGQFALLSRSRPVCASGHAQDADVFVRTHRIDCFRRVESERCAPD